MAASVIDGAALAEGIRREVVGQVNELASHGHRVHLTAVLVGSTGAGELYARRQGEACRAVGIDYELLTLPADSTGEQVSAAIHRLNSDASVTGIMLHLPLPSGLDATELQYQIHPVKDVEGVNPANIGYVVYGHTRIAPCTAQAVIELIRSTGISLRGGGGGGRGQRDRREADPLLLTEQMATVTLCHIATKDLAAHTRRGRYWWWR